MLQDAEVFFLLLSDRVNDRPDTDAVIIERKLEAGNEVRLPHDAHFGRLTLFRLQERVTRRDADDVLTLLAGDVIVEGAIRKHRRQSEFRKVRSPNVARLQGTKAKARDRRLPGDTNLP